MQTETLVPVRNTGSGRKDQADIQQYEIYERYRQGETPQQIAMALGLERHTVQLHLRELAEYARKATRDTASLEMLRAADRYNKVFTDVQDIATDTTVDIEHRLKAYTILLAAQQKLCDLYQLGRVSAQVNAGTIITGSDLTEEAILTECKRLKLPMPSNLAD